MKRGREGGSVLMTMSIALAFLAAAAYVANRQHGMLATDVQSELDTARAQFLARAAVAHATWKADNVNCSGLYPNVSGTLPGQGSYTAAVSIGATAPTRLNISATGTSTTAAMFSIGRSGVRPHSTAVTTTNGTIQSDAMISGNDSAQTKTNYGTAKTLTLNKNQKILMGFANNVYASTTNSLILSEVLTINTSQHGTSTPVTLYAYPVTTAWTEAGVTWNQANSAAVPPVAWTTIGADYGSGAIAQSPIPTNFQAMTFDLTAAAEAWKNNDVPFISNGIALVPSDPTLNNGTYYSREATPSTNQPLLVVRSLSPCA